MVINDDILRRDTVRLITLIELQIVEVEKEADNLKCFAYQVRDANGSWVLSPLLHAKATAYNTLVLLQGKK